MEEEEKEYDNKEKDYTEEDEEVDLSEAAVAADMAMRNVDMDKLLQKIRRRKELTRREEGGYEGGGVAL